MKTLVKLAFLMTLVISGSSVFAQKQVEKKAVEIEYESANGHKKLTLIEKHNGKVTKKIYTGAEAEEKMKELNSEDHLASEKNLSSRKPNFYFDFDVKSLDSVAPELDSLMAEMQKHLGQGALDSLMLEFKEQIDESFENTSEGGKGIKTSQLNGGNEVMIIDEQELSEEEIKRIYGIDISKLGGKQPVIKLNRTIRVRPTLPKSGAK